MENSEKTPDFMVEALSVLRATVRDIANTVYPDAAARAALARAIEFQAQALDNAYRAALDFAVNRCETLQTENAELRDRLTRAERRGKRGK